jgi:hypothetical protein
MIRLELLKLAQSIENERMFAERNRLENDWFVQREIIINKINSSKEELGSIAIPPYPILGTVSYQTILNTAKELNDFVSSKGE